MSFRKRSVKPNLGGAKRLSAAVKSEINQIEKDSSSIKTLSSNEKDINSTLELISNSNDGPKPGSNQNVTPNQQINETSAPLPSKRLSKRFKVTPKITPRSSSKELLKEESLPLKNIPLKSEPPDKINIPSETSINNNSTLSGINSSSAVVNNDMDLNLSRNSTVTTHCEEPNLPVLKTVPNEHKILQENELKEVLPAKQESSQNQTTIEKSSSTGNRLQKRTKVMPRLLKRTVQSEMKSPIPKATITEDKETPKIVTEKPTLNSNISDQPCTSVKECETLNTISVAPCELQKETIVSEAVSDDRENMNRTDDKALVQPSQKKLSKRTKIQPKLSTIRNNKFGVKSEPSLSDKHLANISSPPIQGTEKKLGVIEELEENNVVDQNSLHINQTNLSKTTDQVDITNTIGNDSSTELNIQTNAPSLGTTRLPKKESKQVRFSTDEKQETDNLQLLSDICSTELVNCVTISEQNVFPEAGCLKQGVSVVEKEIDDTIEQSSQSEGENNPKLNFSRRKTFKPNLGARRRKRLSSFSAYSSCDEEEKETLKKRKKNLMKVKDGSDQKEELEEDSKTKKKRKNNTKGKDKTTKSKEKKKKSKRIISSDEDDESDDDDDDDVSLADAEGDGNDQSSKNKKKRKQADKFNNNDTKPVKSKFTPERDLSTLTMQELIYYKPKSFKTVELRSKKEPANEDIRETGCLPPDQNIKPIIDAKSIVKKLEESPIEETDDVIAPQIMINEDGEVVINEESLMLKKKVDDSAIRNSAVLYEDALSFGTNLRRKINRGKRWKIEETLRFYKALSQIGTDFTLMSQAFGRFTRNELKKKFKQEERVNCDLVDRALANRLPLNMELFLKGKEEMRDFLDTSSEASAMLPDHTELDEDIASSSNHEALNETTQDFKTHQVSPLIEHTTDENQLLANTKPD